MSRFKKNENFEVVRPGRKERKGQVKQENVQFVIQFCSVGSERLSRYISDNIVQKYIIYIKIVRLPSNM